MEKRTALPKPPPASSTGSFFGMSVGVPVGPMTTTGSPGLKAAHSRDEVPISRTMRLKSPASGSVQAPVSAMPSVLRRVPSTRGE